MLEGDGGQGRFGADSWAGSCPWETPPTASPNPHFHPCKQRIPMRWMEEQGKMKIMENWPKPFNFSSFS